MKALKVVAIVIASVIVLYLLVALVGPKTFDVQERSPLKQRRM